jgi:glycosyltransferase involved in cell wall biosynthesis
MSLPLISVVTPFYNCASFFKEAIEGVLSQTYSQWELLLVDDGSSDGSTAIARDYEKRFPAKIVYLTHEGRGNRGISASRNLGWRHARGNWLACLDADDVWVPRKLEQQWEIAQLHPEVGLIVGAAEYWHSWTGRPDDKARDQIILVGGQQDMPIPPPRLVEILYPLGSAAAPCPSTFFVRMDLIDSICGWEEQSDNSYEDQYFLMKVYLNASVYNSSTNWVRYRQHPASAMRTGLAGRGYDLTRRKFLKWFETYLIQNGLRKSAAWSRLQHALWQYRHPLLAKMISLGRRLTTAFKSRGHKS